MGILVEPVDMVDRFDTRTLCDLVSDSGTPLTEAQLLESRKLAVAIDVAEGRLLASCRVGQLYAASDIAQLEGHDAALAKDLICTLALVTLMRRRPRPDLYQTMQSITEEAEKYLQQLRDGHRVFDTAEVLEASKPSVEAPTVIEQRNLNLITSRFRGYYPNPANRLPLNRLN